ncbi:hypothetical protein PAT01_22440 [Pseudoalteromonas atlantica]|uniref:Type I restriction modification DNA specificity domain-containing protein n=1 Tax=Pseudoalteromonas atlantica TaxID=288 RepID=A0ABQ0UER1_PSEAF|nr:hypothetical protein PAT01_22440 [Pseudoalteromonas atlantica]
MGSDWPFVSIEDIAEVKSGKRLPKGNELVEHRTEFPYIRLVDVSNGRVDSENLKFLLPKTQEKISRYIVDTDDICLAIVGHTIGMVFYIDSKWSGVNLTENAARITNVSSDFNPRYIYYYLNSSIGQNEIISRKVGSAQGKLPLYNIKSLEIPKVPRAYQDNVVQILDKIDSKIELNKKTNNTLEQMAQALFKSWFVDFDPVFDNLLASVDFKLESLENRLPDNLKLKAQRRLAVLNSLENAAECKASLIALAHELQALSPTKEATQAAVQILGKTAETPVKANVSANPKILAQHANTHAHFPNEFEHNEQLGWIPKGWSASSVEDEFVVKGGSTPSTKNPDFWEDGEIHWTSPKDLSGNTTKIMLDTSRKITPAGLKKITSGLLPIDTVLMSSRAPVGYLALAKVPVAINQGYIAITDAKTLSSEYTIQWLDSVMDEIKGISGGTTFAEISKKTFKSIQLVIPSKKAVEAYTEVTKMYYKRITACVQEINTLTETRDYLLPKLISGELQIPDVVTDEKVVD